MLKDYIYNAPKYAGVYEIRNDECLIYIGYALKLRQTLIKLYQDKIFDKLDTESAKLELKFVQQNSHEPNLEMTLINKANELINQYKDVKDIILITNTPYTSSTKNESNDNVISRPNWRKVFDIATGCTTIKAANNIVDINVDNISTLFKDYTLCTSIETYYDNFIVVDNRFIFMPYDIDVETNEDFKSLKSSLIDKAYMEMDGYIHTDMLAAVTDLFVQCPSYPDYLIPVILNIDDASIQDIIKRAKQNAIDAVYVPYNKFIDYYKLHSSADTKKHFNLTDEQYKNVLRKFYITYFVTDIDKTS